MKTGSAVKLSTFRPTTIIIPVVALLLMGGPSAPAYQYLITDLGGLPGSTDNEPSAINNIGEVVGVSANHAFLYSGRTMTDLGTLGGFLSSYASGINNSGQIVGWAAMSNGVTHAFFYSGGSMIDLGTLGGSVSVANGIDNSGQIVGWSYPENSGTHAFRYSGGTMTNLGNLGVGDSSALGINNSGQIVGWADVRSDIGNHAFLYSNGTMTDLNSLVAPSSWGMLGGGNSINDIGQIVGVGAHVYGITGAFLLTPTAIPPAITSQPQPLTLNAGDNGAFSVTAISATPLTYQWSLNGTNITGATSSSLVISNVAQRDLGSYAVVLGNAFESATSSNAVLSMYPDIYVPFSGAVTYWGKDATFSMQAWGTGPLNYQWFKDGIALLGSTNQTLTLLSIQVTNAGFYSVVVSSPLGSVTNAPAQVVVNSAGVSLGLRPSLTISGVVGYMYAIQGSSDLTNTNSWATLTTLTLEQPVQLWVDTNTDVTLPSNPHRFYRVLPAQ
jgi:probable HAF family extracellular repeat protein